MQLLRLEMAVDLGYSPAGVAQGAMVVVGIAEPVSYLRGNF